MQVVPNVPHPESTGSERLVLKLLRAIDWGGPSARALSSLNFTHHLYQRWGEIDFLLVGPTGLLVIEVKGGRLSCQRGVWSYEDRLGRVVRRSKSPIVQAKDAYYSIVESYVAPKLGTGFASSVPSGFCVILAGSDRAELHGLLGSPELPTELVGTREDVRNPEALASFLRGVIGHWRGKGATRPRIADQDVKSLVGVLRPEFDRLLPLALSSEQAHEEMLRLTEEQLDCLDQWEGARRVFCASPAGCGKTLLALEFAKRAAAEGANVAVVCGAAALANAVRPKLGTLASTYSIQELEAENANPVQASVLVIDEGQQMLSPGRMAILDGLVERGLLGGRWAWFGDPNYQHQGLDAAEEASLLRLQAAATVTPRLRRNCRNTPEIVKFAEVASGIRLGHALAKGRGLQPVLIEAGDVSAAYRDAAGQVAKWMGEGISSRDITVLVTGCGVEEGIVGLSAAGLPAVHWVVSSASETSVRVALAEEFRGLESPFLVLCVVAFDEGDEALGRLLYLAITRANFGLAVVAPACAVERIRRLVETSLKMTGEKDGS